MRFDVHRGKLGERRFIPCAIAKKKSAQQPRARQSLSPAHSRKFFVLEGNKSEPLQLGTHKPSNGVDAPVAVSELSADSEEYLVAADRSLTNFQATLDQLLRSCDDRPWSNSAAQLLCPRGEVAGEVEDEVGGVGGEGIDGPVRGWHDGHIGGDGSVAGIQG